MLRLTKKADYGLMALKYLAEHPGEASLSARDIAAAYHIPPQLLAKILQLLAREGLLRSHAGMNGGYTLFRKPETITVFEVIRIIDGPLFITSCITDAGVCDLTSSCTIKEPLARVNDSISDLLKKIRISDLVEADPAHNRPKAPEQELVSIQLQPQGV
jgi:Rrf2 family protein